MVAFEIRAALPGDEQELARVARHLNTVSSPEDAASIHEIVDHSYRSFTGQITDPRLRTYVFVLIDLASNRIVGSSMIVAQVGRRGLPYVYFDVLGEERYSSTLDRHVQHTLLRIGYSYSGPTEIGGLVLMPDYRLKAERLGTMISYVRFLFLAAHAPMFQPDVLAELMPPLEPDGTSHLWEALGRHFCGMSYAAAEKLSKKNKEFIKALFPEVPLHASVLPKAAQEVIGKTGAQARSVEKLLRRVGFRYAQRVDPLDGGPHFTAKLDEIKLVTQTRKSKAERPLPKAAEGLRALVAVEWPEPPFFRAVIANVRDGGPQGYAIAGDAWEHLNLCPGAPLILLPIE